MQYHLCFICFSCNSVLAIPTMEQVPPSPPAKAAKNKMYQELAMKAEKVCTFMASIHDEVNSIIFQFM